MSEFFLNPYEIYQLTNVLTKDAQQKKLKKMAIPFLKDPTNGKPIVTREAVLIASGVLKNPNDMDNMQRVEPDYTSLKEEDEYVTKTP